MRVFLTGANGFIGTRLVTELIAAGHQVLGLTRSEPGAQRLLAAGAEIHRGTIDDSAALQAGANSCDGIIHTAFDHDFSRYVENCTMDSRAILTIGSVLRGTKRPFVVTSTTLFGEETPGVLADEDVFNLDHPNPRAVSERVVAGLVADGINVSLVRLSQIHDTHRQGLVTFLVDLARRTGRVAYLGSGTNRWSAAALGDTARLYRLALENPTAGARYHATAEEGVTLRSIAETIGERLDLPVVSLSESEARDHFGWLYGFIAKDMIASSEKTCKRLGWCPTGRSLLESLKSMAEGK